MPLDRAGGVKTNGHTTIRRPGAYAHVLRKRCEQDAYAAAPDYLLLAVADVPAWERDKAEHVAALLAERDGKPVRVQSYMLPRGLPAPFENFPVGGQRSFVVGPDDTIRLKPRKVR